MIPLLRLRVVQKLHNQPLSCFAKYGWSSFVALVWVAAVVVVAAVVATTAAIATTTTTAAITFCSCSNNQRPVAVVATMANCSLIVLAMAIFCRKVENWFVELDWIALDWTSVQVHRWLPCRKTVRS